MKEIASGFAEFAAIILILITLAVSTAAVAQWSSASAATESGDDAQAIQVAGVGRG